MIEVYRKGKKKDQILGYIDGKRYLNRKKKIDGRLDGNVARGKGDYPLLILKDNGAITLNEDWQYEEMGYLKDGKIYYKKEDDLVFTFDKESNQIQHNFNENITYLRGEGIEALSDVDFFGICANYLDLFSEGGTSEPDDDDSILDDIADIVDDMF